MAPYGFRLYDQPEIPSVNVPGEDYSHRNDPNYRFTKAWLEKFEGFDYGTMTVWLMRVFGLPNVRGYGTFKNSFAWGLETPEGYVIRVEPGLRRVLPSEYRPAPERRDTGDEAMSKQDFRNALMAGGVFDLCALRTDAPVVTPELIERWLGQFARPIYIRDVGANVLGTLHEQELYEEGPGSEDVLAGGELLADEPVAPRKACPSS